MTTWIGDIGGSSSRWAVIETGRGEILKGTFPGYNPLSGEPGPLQAKLREAAAGRSGEEAPEVFAYGAGCGNPERAGRVHGMLADVWPGAHVQVGTDLLGAARSLYGDDEGLVLILGTGMNVGHYDGGFIHTPMPSLGFILGDEGSGADIGKHLLRDALYGLLPDNLMTALFPDGLDLAEVLRSIHRSPSPQPYVASFTKALAGRMDEHYVHDLVVSRFFALARLLARFFAPAERREVRATGSVAYGFREALAHSLAGKGMTLGTVERDPLTGLLEYHLRHRG